MAGLDEEGDPLTAALSSRRMPHGRNRSGQKGSAGRGKGKNNKGGGTAFNPFSALGYYEIQLGSSNKRARQSKVDRSTTPVWLEIHELTEREDGLIGTMAFEHSTGKISGMMIVAGSRKVLAQIARNLEEDDDNDEENKEDEHERESGHENSHTNSLDRDRFDLENVNSEDENHETPHQYGTNDIHDKGSTSPSPSPSPPPSALEESDQRLNKRFQAFEKNTFRNPKFWVKWKGHVQHSSGPSLQSKVAGTSTAVSKPIETNYGYLVFTGNDCSKFEGTISCEALGWDNLKLQGWKTRSKARPCPIQWVDMTLNSHAQ